MAIVFENAVRCGCGQELHVPLAASVNAVRTPDIRKQILAGTFHTLTCPHCGRLSNVEKSFVYTDLARNTVIQVRPRQERHEWRTVGAAFQQKLAKLDGEFSPPGTRYARIVFGLAELREKLLAQDVGLDDQFLEVLKTKILHAHPFLMDRPRLRLIFDGADRDGLAFVAGYDLSDTTFRIVVASDDADRILASAKETSAAAEEAKVTDPYRLAEEGWVNIWRYSPEPDALAQLKDRAEALKRTGSVDLDANLLEDWKIGLPLPANLPTWAKQALDDLFAYARKNLTAAVQDLLFEIRFGKGLNSEWGQNDSPTDIGTLWDILRALPESHTSGNAWLDEILLDPKTNGGLYNPRSYDIYIGSNVIDQQEKFEDVVRHEIGHAVHARYETKVDEWLAERWGFRMFPARDGSGAEAWIEAMGGWSRLGDLSPKERGEIISYLLQAVGEGGLWEPGPGPSVPRGHPWWGDGFAPREAVERTGGYWFENFAQWRQVGDRRFALNYWYPGFMVLSEAAVQLVADMPDSYAAMSPFEFFAELYGLHFDGDDPQRQAIPEDAREWFEGLGAPTARGAPSPRRVRDAGPFDDVVRPGQAPAAPSKTERVLDAVLTAAGPPRPNATSTVKDRFSEERWMRNFLHRLQLALYQEFHVRLLLASEPTKQLEAWMKGTYFGLAQAVAGKF